VPNIAKSVRLTSAPNAAASTAPTDRSSSATHASCTDGAG
jgi:hypothetical protein